MKKLFSICAIILIVISITGCSGKTKKGTLIGECSKKELTQKDRQDLPDLWDGEVLAKVVLGKGDTIQAAIDKKQMEE